MIEFKEEFDSWNLWPPRNSDFKRNLDWLVDNGHDELRPGVIILESENGSVLTKDSVRILLSIHNQLNKINSINGTTFDDVCHKIPTAYANEVCMEVSLLELWASCGKYDALSLNISKIMGDNDILALINNKTLSISGIYGTPLQYNIVAGGLEMINEHLISAKALRFTYVLEAFRSISGQANPFKVVQEFERKMMLTLSNISLPQGKKVAAHLITSS